MPPQILTASPLKHYSFPAIAAIIVIGRPGLNSPFSAEQPLILLSSPFPVEQLGLWVAAVVARTQGIDRPGPHSPVLLVR